jgi:uncharacterized membrane protein
MITAQTSVYTESTPERVLEYIGDMRHFSDLFDHIQSADAYGHETMRVTLSTSSERRVSWDASFEFDRDGVRWQSLDPNFNANGRIEVKPLRQGSLVNVEFHYAPPLGLIDGAFAKLLGGRGSVLNADLERLSDLIEAQRSRGHENRSSSFPRPASVGLA